MVAWRCCAERLSGSVGRLEMTGPDAVSADLLPGMTTRKANADSLAGMEPIQLRAKLSL